MKNNLARLGAYDRIELSSLQPQCSILAIKLISPYIKVFVYHLNRQHRVHTHNPCELTTPMKSICCLLEIGGYGNSLLSRMETRKTKTHFC